jgi:hypothetical protein
VSCFLGLLVSNRELGLFFTCEDVSQGRDREREREGVRVRERESERERERARERERYIGSSVCVCGAA